MNVQNNQHPLNEQLQLKAKELFPDKAERILEYFATKFEYHFNDYKMLKGFTPSENLMKVCFSAACPYMPITKFDYSYDYFVTYFQNEESDYLKYDNIKNTINSQLIAAFHQLYFSNHKEALQKLIQLSLRKTKGRIINSYLHFFDGLLTAEVELKNRIIVNIQD